VSASQVIDHEFTKSMNASVEHLQLLSFRQYENSKEYFISAITRKITVDINQMLPQRPIHFGIFIS
jgi:hypothetical protein